MNLTAGQLAAARAFTPAMTNMLKAFEEAKERAGMAGIDMVEVINDFRASLCVDYGFPIHLDRDGNPKN